jgi:SPP1 gp7 family putative phage head morphogenesis protein
MALTPEQVHDLAVSHRIGLSRYSTGVVRKVIALLNRTEKAIVERLARTSNETVTGQRLDQLLAEVRAIQADGWALVRARMNADVDELTKAEAEFALRLANPVRPVALATFSPLPPIEQIVAAVRSRPFQGRLLREWLAEAEEGAARRVRDAVRQGFVEGLTTDQIVRSIRGTRAAQYRDGIMETSRRGAEAMVRTALTHTANTAAQATWEANGDIVKAWRFTAVLDLRTTLTCASLHGKQYPLGKGPMPPRHINCRSTSVPVLDPIPGIKPFEFPSYDAWLRRQSPETQADILGVAKAKLFRDGGLTVDRFTDNKGRVLTLDELRRRDADAFRRAGMGPAAAEKPATPKAAPEAPAKPVRTLAAINADHDADMRAYTVTQGRKTGNEHLVVYDAATGKAYPPVTDGKKGSVSFPDWLEKAMREPENSFVLHHNHPGSTSFSQADLLALAEYRGAKGIWAHGHNGSSYYAELGEQKLDQRGYGSAFVEAKRWLQTRVNTQEIAPEDANAVFQHLVTLLLQKRSLVTYRAELQGESLAAFNRSRDLIEEFLARAG